MKLQVKTENKTENFANRDTIIFTQVNSIRIIETQCVRCMLQLIGLYLGGLFNKHPSPLVLKLYKNSIQIMTFSSTKQSDALTDSTPKQQGSSFSGVPPFPQLIMRADARNAP